MDLKTHLAIDRTLCGDVVELEEGYAKVVLKTAKQMQADERGLVHGGFTFGAADFAAKVAVNDPNVVLVAAEVKFLAPVVVGDEVVFEAHIVQKEGKKTKVAVIGSVGDKDVFQGTMQTYTPTTHILDRS
ncbi:methylthioribose-1-phosphate isomerase [Nitratiruptor sp. YY08-26]|uniref:hotdog domain-containing protein n=1 Tax=unclassified Nitratiruptor TaxID=2624044 RepID=UPI00191550F0|nr:MULTISPECIES: hotdog domain-containing protein [unclassified Nitratiruptor]BCD62419.1 methylthioribose-1-phosphate isomerase [Nitratiruptor sp. YY08-13]BCD66355.1 methylthioribose-1-phosphate isomerase [Nitratiruptor sp. YY08-26]